MSVAAYSETRLGKTSLRFAILGLAAASIVWVALMQRGPDPAYLPAMAERAVNLPDGRSVYVQKYEVTVTEWNRCADEGACELTLRTRPDQDPATTPATGLSYVDVQQYVSWINKRSRHDFRLPTAEEWNSMAAAVLPEKPDPIFTDPSLTWASSYLVEGLAPRALKPQGSFSASPEGVIDLDGGP